MIDWLGILVSSGIAFVGNGLILTLLTLWLQSRNARELAKLNASLVKLQVEYETRLTDMHRRRAEAIVELYRLLAIAERVLGNALLDLPKVLVASDPFERTRECWEHLFALMTYYEENRILFTPGQTRLLDGILSIFTSVEVGRFTKEFAKGRENLRANKELMQTLNTQLTEAAKAMEEGYPELKAQLEVDFRSILEPKG